jgi:hypothetical protein
MAEISACSVGMPGPRRQASISYQFERKSDEMMAEIVRVPPTAVHQPSAATVSVAARPPIFVFARGACRPGKP